MKVISRSRLVVVVAEGRIRAVDGGRCICRGVVRALDEHVIVSWSEMIKLAPGRRGKGWVIQAAVVVLGRSSERGSSYWRVCCRRSRAAGRS